MRILAPARGRRLPLLAPGTVLGPYAIVAPLGAGGMGEVYRARDARLGREVAVKVLSARLAATPEARARFEREARTISQLSHPHICALYDVGREGDIDYLVMELLEGETLARRLARGPLPVADVLRLGAEIASALACAHAAGIVHRDLKPGNVMLTRAGAKLMDFGLARPAGVTPAAGTEAEQPTLTQPLTSEGSLLGTFQYMAPEQLEGRDADARSDIWALGCVLYEMATGQGAFEGRSRASLISSIMKEEPRPITELQSLTPAALEHVVTRCLAKDRDERWQSARDAAHELEWSRTASGPGAGTLTAGARVRHKLLLGWIATVVLAVGTAAIATHLLWRDRPAPPSYRRLTFQRGVVSGARFTADGNSVVYSASWEGKPMEMVEMRTDLSSSRSLGLPGMVLQASSTSNVLAVAPILGLPWDAAQWRTLTTVPLSGGAPREVVGDVWAADWTPDGKTLAVVRRAANENRIEMPPGQVLVSGSSFYFALRVSPDGRRVAFVENPGLYFNGFICVVDDRGRKTTLTRELPDVRSLAWTPDGREVWFAAQQEEQSSRHDLCAVTLDGRMRTVLRGPMDLVIRDIARDGRVLFTADAVYRGLCIKEPGAQRERELSWLDCSLPEDVSEDGRTVLFTEEGDGGGPSSVFVRNTDGSPPVRLGEGYGALSLSPDGKWVLAIRHGRPQRLVLLPTGAGDAVVLPSGAMEEYVAGSWLPDGTRVVFQGRQSGQTDRIFMQQIPNGEPTAVTPPGVDFWSEFHVLVSPDGRWIAAKSAENRLALYPLDGGAAKDICNLKGTEFLTQWSADGRSVFVHEPGARLVISRIDLVSGARESWKTIEPADAAGCNLLGPSLSRDGQSYVYRYTRRLQTLYVVDGLK
jgi:eukaryotic-like serine/threonine-protein kinase